MLLQNVKVIIYLLADIAFQELFSFDFIHKYDNSQIFQYDCKVLPISDMENNSLSL